MIKDHSEKKGRTGKMLHTEYVRSLNCNYERILLEKKPEEQRYQYCILSRGGIKGLLPCSLRYINGLAYLYYDISSRQNVTQLFSSRCITREWMTDFMWSLKHIQQELGRFLLDMGNILWYPEQIFQELESNMFSFMYIPYYTGEASFMKLIEFWVEHIDYEDEVLVDCVYHMYEQLEHNGDIYLQARIFEDAKCLEEDRAQEMRTQEKLQVPTEEKIMEEKIAGESAAEDKMSENVKAEAGKRTETVIGVKAESPKSKRGIFSIFEGKKNRGKKLREEYSLTMQQAMTGYAVAEETNYEAENFGRTIFIEEQPDASPRVHRLYTPEGRLLASLERPTLSIGKKKEEVDLVLEDASVSRIHARITEDNGKAYLEDLNSTNGTFKNGLRMLPYEKKKLEEGDEIKCGKVILVFR